MCTVTICESQVVENAETGIPRRILNLTRPSALVLRIKNEELCFPEDIPISKPLRNLLSRMLAKQVPMSLP